jgi:hypothetical protein
MPVAFILDFADGTSAQYDAVVEDMQLGGHTAAGGLFHGAGATATGWRVVDVWENDAIFQQFAAEKIGPISQAHGLPEPEIERIEVGAPRVGPGGDAQFLQVVRLAGIDGDTFEALDGQILPDGSAPEGCVFHVNGAGADGWVVVDYWTSRDLRDAFIAGRVMPAMQAAGVSDPPQFEDLELHSVMTPA